MASRADLIEWIADEIPAALAWCSSGDPWDAASLAFLNVMGRWPAERWGAVTPSPAADIEDALVCWDTDLCVEAITAAGLEAD